MDQPFCSEPTVTANLVETLVAEAGISHPMPAIFKLNIDCFAKIFDYLSLVELINAAQTCKLMRKVCGEIFHLHYPYVRGIVDDDRIYLRNHNEVREFVNIFSDYIQIALFQNKLPDTRLNRYKSIKIAHFHYVHLREDEIEMMDDVVGSAKLVQFTACQFENGMFEHFLDNCKNMQVLAITFAYNCGVGWLQKYYPNLKQLAILPILNCCYQIKELTIFFKQNPNVRMFYTSWKFLSNNIAFIMHAKFDALTIFIDDMDFDSFRVFLNELHSQGVYKRLYVMFFEYFDMKQSVIDQMSRSIKGLRGLCVPFNVVDIDLASLINLEILQFTCNVNQIVNMPSLAHTLIDLKEINFYKANMDDILPFVHHLTQLKKIAIARSDDDHGLNLLTINKMRKKLLQTTTHVSRATVYIPEANYLKTRRESITMSQELVEVQRYDQYNYVRFWNWMH